MKVQWQVNPLARGFTMDANPHVVIVGGGFGGLNTAHGLARAPVRVTLVDKRNYHLFRPLLYQVATGLLSADEIAAPLRSIFSRQRKWPLNESVLPLRDSRTSETASGGLRLWRLVGGLAYGSLPTGSASIHRQCSASAALSPAQASPSDNHRGAKCTRPV